MKEIEKDDRMKTPRHGEGELLSLFLWIDCLAAPAESGSIRPSQDASETFTAHHLKTRRRDDGQEWDAGWAKKAVKLVVNKVCPSSHPSSYHRPPMLSFK